VGPSFLGHSIYVTERRRAAVGSACVNAVDLNTVVDGIALHRTTTEAAGVLRQVKHCDVVATSAIRFTTVAWFRR